MPIDRQSCPAWCGVWLGLMEWYRAAESIMATSPTSQLREEIGERNQMSAGESE